MNPRRCAAMVGIGALTFTGAPAVTSIGPLRRHLAPKLSGISSSPHIALTFDDGPDPTSTPAFLDLLTHHQRRATFFVLGSQATANAPLLRRMVSEGHELALHGWTHRCTPAIPPTRLLRQLQEAQHVVEDIAGMATSWYRPPYGVLSTETMLACRTLNLTPVLWSAWGREWERSATPARIVASVQRTLRPGGTILLHDTDRHAPRGDWRSTLVATAALLSGPLESGHLGPLREHWQAPGLEKHLTWHQHRGS
ncbi:MAG: polysaccharide deacetylase family protein [Ornithinibacter sp.]